MKLALLALLALTSVVIFFYALRQCRRGNFFGDTVGLWWLGIYVWGDALVLAPFWLISCIAFMSLSGLGIFRWLCLFFLIRAAYEVVYWLNHQAVESQYRPPFMRNTPWLPTAGSAIIYQLLAFCQVVLFSAALLFSYGLL